MFCKEEGKLYRILIKRRRRNQVHTNFTARIESFILICVPGDNIDKILDKRGYLTFHDNGIATNSKLFNYIGIVVLNDCCKIN